VAGTSLYIADQYLTPRSIVTFALLFAVLNALNGRKVAWLLWAIIAICIHPLMAMIGLSFTAIVWWMNQRTTSFEGKWAMFAQAMLPFRDLAPASSHAYQEAVDTRPYFFLLRWEWYEWLGAIAPLFLLWWIGRLAARRANKTVSRMSASLII